MVTLANRDHRQGGSRIEERRGLLLVRSISGFRRLELVSTTRAMLQKLEVLFWVMRYPKFRVSTNGLNTHPGATIHSACEVVFKNFRVALRRHASLAQLSVRNNCQTRAIRWEFQYRLRRILLHRQLSRAPAPLPHRTHEQDIHQ
jgi:hypothetical protein